MFIVLDDLHLAAIVTTPRQSRVTRSASDTEDVSVTPLHENLVLLGDTYSITSQYFDYQCRL
jgi:hypothetical protein